MSSNDPFGTDAHNPFSFSDTPQVQLPPDMQRGLVHHVTALSILTVVQGVLVTLYGIGLGVLAFVMPVIMQAQGGMRVAPAPVVESAPVEPKPEELIPEDPESEEPIPEEPMPVAPMPVAPMPVAPMPVAPFPVGFEWMMLAIYGSMGLVSLVIGVLGIWAGIRMMRFRGRTFGIVALSSGLLSLAGCYCLPTAIGLFVYGLIVLLNPSVKHAFEMGEQGHSANEIQNHFARLAG